MSLDVPDGCLEISHVDETVERESRRRHLIKYLWLCRNSQKNGLRNHRNNNGRRTKLRGHQKNAANTAHFF